jgi:hypothetical protein
MAYELRLDGVERQKKITLRVRLVGNQVTRTQAPYGDGIEEYLGTDNVITGNTCKNSFG